MTNAELARSIAAVEAENFDLMPDGYTTDEQLAAYDPATMATPLMDESSLMAPPYMDQTAAPTSQQVINITSQEQFDALPEFQKEIIRAQAAGVSIPAKYQEQLAVESIKQNLQPPSKAGTIEVVKDPVTGEDIRVFNSSDGSAYPMATPAPTKFERVVAEDGAVMMVDPYSGKSFPAWDNESGQPVRARVGGQPLDEDARRQRERLQRQLNTANATLLDYEQRVARGDKSWFGRGEGYEKDLDAARAAVAELTRQMSQLGAAPAAVSMPSDMPSDMPASTPAATPAPTPESTPPPDPRPMPPQRPAGMPSDMPASPQQISAASSVQGNMTPRDPQLADSPAYTSAVDVQAAYRSGQLTRDEALKILQTQFNYR